jgi:hypothetical protein
MASLFAANDDNTTTVIKKKNSSVPYRPGLTRMAAAYQTLVRAKLRFCIILHRNGKRKLPSIRLNASGARPVHDQV